MLILSQAFRIKFKCVVEKKVQRLIGEDALTNNPMNSADYPNRIKI